MKYIFFTLIIFSFSCNSQTTVENIVLVNAGTIGREDMADVISKIHQLQPKVIAIDFQFSTERNPEIDNKLVSALNKCQNLVMISIIDNYSPDRLFQESFKLGSLPKFTKNAKTGFANLMFEDGNETALKKFSQLEYVNGKVEFSFALRTAYQYDSARTKRYMMTHENFNIVNFEKGLKRFTRFSAADFLANKLTGNDIREKIVMVGFLGPGNEDRFFAPILGSNDPNIYGLEFHAQVVSQILQE